MALISAKTIITSLCLFHITLGFFFLTSPGSVADQALVYLLGEAMGLPHSRNFESRSPALAFLAVVLGMLGISDMVTLSLPDEFSMVHHWGLQAPLRFTFSFAIVLYTFFFSASSPFYADLLSAPPPSSSADPSSSLGGSSAPGGYAPSGWGGDALKNRLFFAFMFVETVSWFWVWVTLQEENREAAVRARKAARRRSSHDY
ncbi:increased loss of mitochondrial DNA protein 1 [Lasiosphaeria ovina]|uniref:Increased loss of mitochondrial DNA protein 1 n=1 Tax=Lasiosphaeria ovina TaxID=92902 RepID=A0AAE0NB70_9PEZI|nr:increased loss of mitochondrial DNA protein 1 [Lasiosphaeria ovina]